MTAESAPAVTDPRKQQVIDTLHDCYDPEIPVNIYDLGLIYDVRIEPESAVTVVMTLTSPMCPVAGIMPLQVKSKIEQSGGWRAVKVELTWDPVWNPMMMSEAARLQLGLTGWQAPPEE